MSDGQTLFNTGDIAFGKYCVGKLLGSGAFGEVYEAWEVDGLARRVALKILLPKHNSTPTIPERFRDEAKYLIDIRNARRTNAFPEVYGHGYHPESKMHHIALEMIEGTEILEVMKRYPRGMPVEMVKALATKILVAVNEMHIAGVVHRDLKPENIMITPTNEVRIVDLGIATRLEENEIEDRLTKTGTHLGTVSYMSPEQCMTAKVDTRSDLFSVAVVLYEMLTGAGPFQGANVPIIMNKICNLPVEPLPDSVPAHVRRAVMGGLEKKVEDRWKTAEEFLEALEEEDEDVVRRSPTTVIPDIYTPPNPPNAPKEPRPGHALRKLKLGRALRKVSLKHLILAGVVFFLGSMVISLAFLSRKKPVVATVPVTRVPPRDASIPVLPPPQVPPPDAAAPTPDASVPNPPDASVPDRQRGQNRRGQRDAGRAERPRRHSSPRCNTTDGFRLINGQCCKDMGGGAMLCDGGELP